jgi:hypothetical protein
MKVLCVPKHPFMDHGLPQDLLISRLLYPPDKVIFEVIPDMSRWSMSSHKPVKETARGRISRHLYH